MYVLMIIWIGMFNCQLKKISKICIPSPTQMEGIHVFTDPASDKHPAGPERISAPNLSHL